LRCGIPAKEKHDHAKQDDYRPERLNIPTSDLIFHSKALHSSHRLDAPVWRARSPRALITNRPAAITQQVWGEALFARGQKDKAIAGGAAELALF
jgi:hypothetical protein